MASNNEAVAEVQMVAFKLEKEEFAVDIHQVREDMKMTRVTPLPQSAHYIEGLINLRGEVIPVVDLRKRFELPRERSEQADYCGIRTATWSDCRFGNKFCVFLFGDPAPRPNCRYL